MRAKSCLEARVAKISSDLISEDALHEVHQWRPPSVRSAAGEPLDEYEEPSSPLTAEQLESIQKAAYQEGFDRGRKEGQEAGHQEALAKGRQHIQAQVSRFEALMTLLDRPLEQLDNQVEQELIELVITMVRQLVRREMKTHPEQIIGVVREALSILPVSSRDIRVLLHPEDATLVKTIYELSENDLVWKIVEDPVLARGGCRVVTELSQVDATLESRLAALIAPLLSGERDEDGE